MRIKGGVAAALVAAGAALCALPRVAEAQIVNVQSLVGADAPEGFSGALDAAADWRTGNVDLLVLGAAATVRYRATDHLVFLTVKGDFAETGEPGAKTKIVSRTFEHLRYRLTVSPLITAEAFAQNEADEFRRLLVRALVGAGPRFNLIRRDNFKLALGVAYMFEYELLRDDGLPDADTDSQNHRMSSYVLVAANLNDKVTISETVYLQPRLDDFGDFRLLNEFGLTSKLTTKLSFRFSFVLARDSTPPASIEKLDTTLQTGISLAF